MPMFGLGTWQNNDPETCARVVETALDVGYRHIDTAQSYGNEKYVGDGIEASDVPREEVFLATKVARGSYGYDEVIETARDSIERLGVDYVDLLYVHWPSGGYDPQATLDAFDDLYQDDYVHQIGVSNFTPEQVTEAIEAADAPVFANQVEMHPLLQQRELREHCADNGVQLVAYSPLARGKVFDVPPIEDVAAKHGVTEAQVSLAWLRQKGVTAIPKSANEEHLRENFRSVSLELDDDDIERIDAIDRDERIVDPGFAPW